MAKRRAKRVTKTSEKPRVRAGANLNVWIPEAVMRAFEELCERETRTKREQVIVLFKDALAKCGLWPPPDAD